MIATEQGWNLYVGGNGGCHPGARASCSRPTSTPRTLVRYIDRFLMYYIRTADRLQRTARLDRVARRRPGPRARGRRGRPLGLAAELEAAMARHVDTYVDEWRATLDDPEKLARFVSFVNAPDVPDPTSASRQSATR